MYSGGVDFLSLLYTFMSVGVPVISFLTSRGRAKKKDVDDVTDKMKNRIAELEAVDKAQQDEINRLHRIRKYDQARLHTLHTVIRDGNPVVKAELGEIKELVKLLHKGGDPNER